jgi:tetratricopeptide (TPR) repeat protein
VRAKALAVAGELANFQADYGRALAWLEESLALYRTVADPFGLARAQFFLGDYRLNRGEFDPSIQALGDALAGFRKLDATAWVGVSLYYLSTAASLQHDNERARALAEEALDLCRQEGFGTGTAMVLGRLGTLALRQGAHEKAEQYFREALALRLKNDDRYGIASHLTDLAYLAADRGEAARAARLVGAASAMREAINAEIDEVHRADYQRLVTRLRDTLGNTRFEEAWSAGHARTPDLAVAMVGEVTDDVLPTTAATSTRATPSS